MHSQIFLNASGPALSSDQSSTVVRIYSPMLHHSGISTLMTDMVMPFESYVPRDVLTPDQVCGEVVSLLHQVSLLTCAVYCWGQISMCFMYVFNSTTNACLLFSGLTYQNTIGTTLTVPFIAFKGVSNCERSGYTHAIDEGFCYKLLMTPVTWAEARTACEDDHGQLAVFKTYKQVAYFMNNYGGTITGSYWIGLYDPHKNSTWEWVDGSTFNYSVWQANLIEFNKWDTGVGNGDQSADCVIAYPFMEMLLDVNCRQTTIGVCERPQLL
ncbi:uncharacterized protein [Argopecten irradians]|uniref:uncharacterized protein n=1 Tax=Argopecten irradians TaxID=31199 RepID=UPI00371188F5